MASQPADRVLETSTTTGTGTLTLAGAVTGYQTFAAVGNGNTTPYCIFGVDADGIPTGEWETGIGTYASSGTTLARTTVQASSNSSAAVDFSAGTKYVASSPTCEWITSNIVDLMPWWGDGSDGAVSSSSGTTTLTRDMHYTTLTLTGTAKINTAGYRLHCSVLLDISNAGANAINNDGNVGGASTANSAGSAASAVSTTAMGQGYAGTAGTVGATGASSSSSAVSSSAQGNGGSNSGRGGQGGTTGGNAGATAGALTSHTNRPLRRAASNLIYGVSIIIGGQGGIGGTGGRGDGSNLSGGGGGGGGGAAVLWIAARTISRGASTAAAAISATGGVGGAGGNANATGDSAGGGGGGGGCGGWAYLIYGALAGATGTNAVDASGGAGGVGGTGTGTGTGGGGGQGGGGGRITIINATANTVSETVGSTGTTGGAPSGTTGGSSGAGHSNRVSL